MILINNSLLLFVKNKNSLLKAEINNDLLIKYPIFHNKKINSVNRIPIYNNPLNPYNQNFNLQQLKIILLINYSKKHNYILKISKKE